MDNYSKEEQLNTIAATNWSKDHAAILSQARVFQNDEAQRLKTTTLKVQIYLGLLIAIPAATAAVLRLGGNMALKQTSVTGFLLTTILSISTFFWLRAMWHGQQALAVGTYHFMDVGDFRQAAEASKPSSVLIAKILEIAVSNQTMHNQKITSLRKMEKSIFKLVVTLSAAIVGTLAIALWPYIVIVINFIKCVCS